MIRIRDGFALTATGTLDVKIFNVNERPTFDPKIKNATYFTTVPNSNVGLPLQYLASDPEDGTLTFTFLVDQKVTVIDNYHLQAPNTFFNPYDLF